MRHFLLQVLTLLPTDWKAAVNIKWYYTRKTPKICPEMGFSPTPGDCTSQSPVCRPIFPLPTHRPFNSHKSWHWDNPGKSWTVPIKFCLISNIWILVSSWLWKRPLPVGIFLTASLRTGQIFSQSVSSLMDNILSHLTQSIKLPVCESLM